MTLATRSLPLLDRRYAVTDLLYSRDHERHYAGRHVELGRPAHIVALRGQGVDGCQDADADISERFWRHVALAAQLRHPAFARVRDGFCHEGVYCVVIDELAGETLGARLRRTNRLSMREALAMALHLCDALATLTIQAPALAPLTSITPESLIYTSTGQITLTNLGWRRWLENCRPTDEQLPYCAPEIIAGSRGDVRSDIYSVAALFYSALAGAPISADAHERAPLSTLEPFVPVAISTVIERAMQADPGARFATPADFGAALGAAVYKSLPALIALISSPRVHPRTQSVRKPAAIASPMITALADAPMAVGLTQTHNTSDLHNRHDSGYQRVLRWPHLWTRETRHVFKHTSELARAAFLATLHLDV